MTPTTAPCIYCGEHTLIRLRGATPVPVCFSCLKERGPPTQTTTELR